MSESSSEITNGQVHWVIRVGDGNNFIQSSKKKIWGVSTSNKNCNSFLKKVKEGDLLWFVKAKSSGQIIAVSTYVSQKPREIGPLVSLTETNEELGWNGNDDEWDIEVHYDDLYNLTDCELFSHIQSPCVIRRANEKINIDFDNEYYFIKKYSKVKKNMT